MTRRRKRLALSGLSALILVAGATALAVLTTSGGAGQAAEGEAETPTALAAHLAQLKQAMPGNPGLAEEGPGSAAGAEYAKRAYPDDVISVSEMNAAAAAATSATTRFFSGQGRRGQWVFAGPSEALYPLERFRNASQLRAELVRRGRPHDVDCHRRHVHGSLHRVHHRRWWRRLAHA